MRNGSAIPIANFQFNETSPAAPGTVASSQPVIGGVDPVLPGVCGFLSDYDGAEIVAEFGGATGGTLDVYVQTSPDEGAHWYDMIHFPQAAAGSGAKVYQAPISTATTTTTTTAIGKDLSPALANGAVVNGAMTDRIRLVMVAGAGTSAGTSVVVKVCPQRPRVREGGETSA